MHHWLGHWLMIWSGCSPPSTGPGSDGLTCEVDRPARSPLRRLTHEELDNTLRDLVGDDTLPATRLLPPERLGGFSNNVDVRTVDEATAAGYAQLAREVAERMVTKAPLACDPGTEGCVAEWLGPFLQRAWRRPTIEPARVERLVAFFDTQRASWGAEPALRLLLEVVLQSPDFLYRLEPTMLGAAPGEVAPLTGYEIANRLSYFLWSTMPDEALWQAAVDGELDTAEGVALHTRRLLEHPRADANIHRFFEEWLELDALDTLEKDPTLFPEFDEALADRWREEVHHFLDEVWFVEGARYDTLLTASWTVIDPELAAFYDLPAPPTDDFARVERPAAHHAGILTQGAFLATRARSYESSPIHRGLFVRGPLLCESMHVPDQFDVDAPTPDPDATTREELSVHQTEPVCAACHALIDPPGLAFEHFDAIGRYRTHDGVTPVDATGELAGTDVDGPFDGAPELAARLVESPTVQRCFSRQWFRFAHGRRDTEPDACSVEHALSAFRASDLDMRELIVATTTAPAFRSAVGPITEDRP